MNSIIEVEVCLKAIKKYNIDIRVSYKLINSKQIRSGEFLNKAIQMAKSDKILFSDDDGIFVKDAVLKHLYALDKHVFCAGAIIRDRILKRQSKSILQGTNYSFQRDFFNTIGGYDETYVQSEGGGDVEQHCHIVTVSHYCG